MRKSLLALALFFGLAAPEAVAQCVGQAPANTVCAAPNSAAGVFRPRAIVTNDLSGVTGTSVGKIPLLVDVGGGTPGMPAIDGSLLTGVIGGSFDPTDLPTEGTEADPGLAFDGLGVRFDDAARELTFVAGIKGDVTFSPEDAFKIRRVDGGHRIGLAQNFDSGLCRFCIDTSQGSPKIVIEGLIANAPDDAADIGVRRYAGTAEVPTGIPDDDIGHISSRQYDQFAPIWSDGSGTANFTGMWFPPEFQLGRPLLATGSGPNFTIEKRQHTSGFTNSPVDLHRYYIRIKDVAQASIPISTGSCTGASDGTGRFSFNGTLYGYRHDDGSTYSAGTVPREGVWYYHAATGCFRADVQSGTNSGQASMIVDYRTSTGGAILPFFGRAWDESVWIASAPTGSNREAVVTLGVSPRDQMVPRVSIVLAGKGVLIPGGGFYFDKLSDDGFYAPDNYPRDGSVDFDGPFYNNSTETLLDPVSTSNALAISPGVDADSSTNHMQIAPMGALSVLSSEHTRFPTFAMREGPSPIHGVDFAFDQTADKVLIKGVDQGAAVTVEDIVRDPLGNVSFKITDGAFEEQEIILIEGSPVDKLNGFWSVHPQTRNYASLHGSNFTDGEIATADGGVAGTTVRRVSNSTLVRIGYAGANKNDWEFVNDVEIEDSLTFGAFSATGASDGKQILASNSWRTDSSVDASSDRTHMQFYNTNGAVGRIKTEASATSYVTSSDERLKENFQPIDSGPIIDAMQMYHFDWIRGGDGYGPKAQELYEVFPDAVSVGGADPETDPWGYDPSKLVPILVSEIKALRARVQALEAAQP